jgi:DGQHR domain-containing protein
MNYVEIGADLEKKTITFLRKIGLKNIDGGPKFIIGGRQIDAVGGYEDTLLIIECTTQADLKSKIDEFRGKINTVISGFKSHEIYQKYKKFRLILAVGKTPINQDIISKAQLQEPKIYIWDEKYTSYYSTLIKSIKQYALFGLLADTKIQPSQKESIDVAAFSANVGIKKYRLFLFFVEAQKLLKMVYVARRESGGATFYQRMVQRARLTTIARYIEKDKIFPNSIIIALGKGCWKFKDLSNDLTINDQNFTIPTWEKVGKLTIGDTFSSCWIIDGQHRLYSYAHTTVPGFLPVAAFAEINEDSQAEYFLDINREAKPVSPDLLWDLLGSINIDSSKGIISNSVKKLNLMKNGFFDHKINIPSIGIGKFRFNNICVSLEINEFADEKIGTSKSIKRRNPFYDKDSDRFSLNLANGINHYITELNKGISPESIKHLYSDGLISVLITLYKYLIAFLVKKPLDGDLKKFLDPLWQYFNSLDIDGMKTLRKNLSSEGGKTEFKNELIRVIQEGYDPNYGLGIVPKEKSLAELINDLENQLNQWVNSILVKEVGIDWIEDPTYFNDPGKRKMMLERAKKQNCAPWEFLDFNATIQIITKGDLWTKKIKSKFATEVINSPDEIKSAASKLWEYRSNKYGHNRSHVVIYSRVSESIIKGYYQIFEKIISHGLSEIEKTP